MKTTHGWDTRFRLIAAASMLAAPGIAGAVTAGDIAKNPQKYEGSQVTVRADVDKVFDRRYFTLDEDAAFAGPDVLVLVPDASRVIDEDEEVIVTGTVRPFVQTEIEREYTWFKPQDDIVTTFKSRPVIVATSVVAKDGRDLVGRPPAATAPTPVPVPEPQQGQTTPSPATGR